ncbi:hypothetical protein NUM3379_21280 [Kineococcus sp. NUM-3379]
MGGGRRGGQREGEQGGGGGQEGAHPGGSVRHGVSLGTRPARARHRLDPRKPGLRVPDTSVPA